MTKRELKDYLNKQIEHAYALIKKEKRNSEVCAYWVGKHSAYEDVYAYLCEEEDK